MAKYSKLIAYVVAVLTVIAAGQLSPPIPEQFVGVAQGALALLGAFGVYQVQNKE